MIYNVLMEGTVASIHRSDWGSDSESKCRRISKTWLTPI